MNKEIIIKNYWSDIDQRIEKLCSEGSVKLPSLKGFNLHKVANDISKEMGNTTFKELCLSHKIFLKEIELNKYLVPKLFNLAKNIFKFKGNFSNQYHIARKVEPGNSKEMYRAHFDSHIFTLVLPIKIPKSDVEGESGELIYFPKIRKMPKHEISNLIGKAYYKKYASKQGIDKLSKFKKKKVDNFSEYQPLLFLGKTTLHTNFPVLNKSSSYRLTLLAHFFDDSPKYSIGNLLRSVRKR